MEINSMVVIDDNLDNRVAFGMAVEEVRGDIDYYPFAYNHTQCTDSKHP